LDLERSGPLKVEALEAVDLSVLHGGRQGLRSRASVSERGNEEAKQNDGTDHFLLVESAIEKRQKIAREKNPLDREI